MMLGSELALTTVFLAININTHRLISYSSCVPETSNDRTLARKQCLNQEIYAANRCRDPAGQSTDTDEIYMSLWTLHVSPAPGYWMIIQWRGRYRLEESWLLWVAISFWHTAGKVYWTDLHDNQSARQTEQTEIIASMDRIQVVSEASIE